MNTKVLLRRRKVWSFQRSERAWKLFSSDFSRNFSFSGKNNKKPSSRNLETDQNAMVKKFGLSLCSCFLESIASELCFFAARHCFWSTGNLSNFWLIEFLTDQIFDWSKFQLIKFSSDRKVEMIKIHLLFKGQYMGVGIPLLFRCTYT